MSSLRFSGLVGAASAILPSSDPRCSCCFLGFLAWELGLGGTLGDIDPLNKVPFKRARSRV